jgi:hypothetical protein
MTTMKILAMSTGESTATKIAYILFLTKMQKGETLLDGFALMEKTISHVFNTLKRALYCK